MQTYIIMKSLTHSIHTTSDINCYQSVLSTSHASSTLYDNVLHRPHTNVSVSFYSDSPTAAMYSSSMGNKLQVALSICLSHMGTMSR